LTSGRKFGLRP